MAEKHREWLMVREAGRQDARIEVGRSPLRIGRGPDNEIVLVDGYASGHHAELVGRSGDRAVRDLGSTNGTRLNGQPLAPGSPFRLHDGDVIQIGASELTYRFGTGAGRSANGLAASGNGVALGIPDHTSVVGLPYPTPTEAPLPKAGRSASTAARRLAFRLALLLVLVGVVVGAGAWLLAPPRVLLLVMGSDARPDELRRGEGGRTDTLLAVVVDRSPRGIGLISIPRDLWVEIPGYGAERINVALAVGGPRVAERTAGDVLGLPLDRYLLIGLQGVRDVVDAAGGVEIDVPSPIHDDAYPTDDYGTVVIDIPAGRQHMDGETALRYARTRHQDNDFGRMGRQQQVMLAVRSSLLRPTNWWRIPAVIAAVRSATRTDLGVLDLATLALAVGGGSTEPDRLALDLDVVEEFRGGGGAYLLRPTPAVRQRVAAFLSPSSAAVEVLNGTATAGLARQAADRLEARGLHVASVGNAGRLQSETTVEIRPGMRRAGAAVATGLDLPSVRVREHPALPAGIDVRVTIGG